MRVFSLLCVLHAAGAMPTYAHSALDRQHAAMYLQLGECLWAALPATRPPGTSTATYDMDLERAAAAATRRDGDLVLCLTLSAAEPFVRRFLFVPGPVRLSLARLAADHALEGFGDMSMNVFRNFRFRLEHLPRLVAALKMPDEFSTRARYRFTGEEGLLVLLTRFKFPSTLQQLSHGTSALNRTLRRR